MAFLSYPSLLSQNLAPQVTNFLIFKPGLVDCNAMYTYNHTAKFRCNILSPSSGLKNTEDQRRPF